MKRLRARLCIAGAVAIATTAGPVLEDRDAREALPLFKTIPAAKTRELTPSSGKAFRRDYSNWPRSHGDETSSRYSGLTQITPANVRNLKVAWVYHSKDGSGNIQCNPVIVDGVVYAPTVGNFVVAIN